MLFYFRPFFPHSFLDSFFFPLSILLQQHTLTLYSPLIIENLLPETIQFKLYNRSTKKWTLGNRITKGDSAHVPKVLPFIIVMHALTTTDVSCFVSTGRLHIHTYIHAFTHTHIHAFRHTHLYIHTNMHIHVHIYIHSHIHTCMSAFSCTLKACTSTC